MAEKNDFATDPLISIGTLADKLGVSVSTIRKYEADGLIISHRTESGHRLFSLEDVDRIRKIQQMIQDIGLNVEGIRRLQALLPCWEILPCTAENRNKCPAYKDITKPCWMIMDLQCAEGNTEKCRNCIVYRFGSKCIDDMKDLVHGREHDEKLREKIRTTVNNWDKK